MDGVGRVASGTKIERLPKNLMLPNSYLQALFTQELTVGAIHHISLCAKRNSYGYL
jgi:hypothetical protein